MTPRWIPPDSTTPSLKRQLAEVAERFSFHRALPAFDYVVDAQVVADGIERELFAIDALLLDENITQARARVQALLGRNGR